MSDIDRWTGTRTPEAPEAFRSWLRVEETGEGDYVEKLLDAGTDALDAAVVRTGRDREAAFLLLRADAMITYACEAAAGSEGLRERLEEILYTVLERREPGMTATGERFSEKIDE